MTKYTLLLTLILFQLLSCNSSTRNTTKKSEITCTDDACEGAYVGAEFVNGSDIAHQFSNEMSKEVGDKLKEFYRKGQYMKVDFSNIQMYTVGMGTGTVRYKLRIPFKRVGDKCQAYTSFDHVGGWDHTPELNARKSQLKSVLLEGEKLDISKLKTTPEGLQEYWIQWKNKGLQAECGLGR